MLILYRVAFLTKRSSQGKFSLPTHCYNLLSPKQFFFLWRMIDVSSEERQVTENVSLFKRREWTFVMHQSIPASTSNPPPPPPGFCGAFARLVSPGGGTFANFALPGGRAFANPRAIPELLTRTRFPIKNRNKLQRVVKACSRFYLDVCISSLLIKPELHSEIGAIDVNQRFLVIESNFCWYYLKNILSYL